MIRKTLFSLFSAAIAVAAIASPPHRPMPKSISSIPTRAMNEIVSNQILVKFTVDRAKDLAMSRPQPSTLNQFIPGSTLNLGDLTFVNRLGHTGWTLWSIPSQTDVQALAKRISQENGVLHAEPVNKVYPLLNQPNDPDFTYQETDPVYVLDLSGNGGLSFRRLWHLDDDNAWAGWSTFPNQWYTSTTKPADTPTVAVIDSGLDTGHGDFINAGGSGIDVSRGGQIDLSRSTGFTLGSPDASASIVDGYGHGTHVTGLAIASGNNGAYAGGGVIGIGYNAKGTILKVIGDSGSGTDADAAAAMLYAADNGAEVINLSLGTTNFSQVFQDATTYAFQKGSLVVAAGNENGHGGGALGPIYPAGCSGAMAVTATGPSHIVAVSYAGIGPYVDVAAPGGELLNSVDSVIIQYVYSTACSYDCTLTALSASGAVYPPYTPNYSYLAGTSMAAPQVAGAAVLYEGQNAIHQGDGGGNLKTYRAIEKSAQGVLGAPYGGWEETQGYGCLDVGALTADADSRTAVVGAIKGLVYSNGTIVAGATVRIRDLNGVVKATTTTQAFGFYRFEGVLPGTYSVEAAPFGQFKSRLAMVKAGSDLPGFDFWCGTYTGDTTPAIIRFLDIPTRSNSGIDVHSWAYDTETGIDSTVYRIGTASGSGDVMADRSFPQDGNLTHLGGLTLQTGVIYYLQETVTNGAGLATVQVVPFSLGGVLSGAVTLADYVGPTTTLTLEIRNPGSTTPLETRTVSSGTFSITTSRVGTFDVAVKGAHWLRKTFHNVVFTTAGASGISAKLINGDVLGHNQVTIDDYHALIRAFRATPASSNWNPNADLDGDLVVAISDYRILVKNYRKIGDP